MRHFTFLDSSPWRTPAALLASTLLLTACGGPSEADIKSALDKSTASTVESSKRLAGDLGGKLAEGVLPKVQKVHKIGCKEDGDNAYRCDVELESTQLGSSSKDVASLRLLKGSDGWILAPQ